MCALTVWTAAAAGCERRATLRANTISRERFVATNVALRTLDTAKTNHAEVLKRNGVTEGQLRTFVAAHAGDTILANVWEEIAKGVESKLGKTEAAAAFAPVEEVDSATPAVIRKLPRPLQARTPPRAQAPLHVEESDTAARPITPAPAPAPDTVP